MKVCGVLICIMVVFGCTSGQGHSAGNGEADRAMKKKIMRDISSSPDDQSSSPPESIDEPQSEMNEAPTLDETPDPPSAEPDPPSARNNLNRLLKRPSSPHRPSQDLRNRLQELFSGIIDSIQGYLPSTSITEIKQKYPWIKNPKPVDPKNIPKDKRKRLSGPKGILKKLGVNDNTYDLMVRVGAKAPNGKYRVRFDQKWRGVPIRGSVIVAEQEDTGLLLEDTVDGEYVTNIDADVDSPTPSLSESEALKIAKRHHGDENKQIENTNIELMITMQDGVAKLSYVVDYFVPDHSNGNTPNPTTQSAPSYPSSTPSSHQTHHTSSHSPCPWVHSDNQNKPAPKTWGGYTTTPPATIPPTTTKATSESEGRNQYSSNIWGSGPRSPSPWLSRFNRRSRGSASTRSIFRDVQTNPYRGLGSKKPEADQESQAFDDFNNNYFRRKRQATTETEGPAPIPVENEEPLTPVDPLPVPDKEILRTLMDTEAKRPFTIIDANTGQVYQGWNGLASAYNSARLILGNPRFRAWIYTQTVDYIDSTRCRYSYRHGSYLMWLNDYNDYDQNSGKVFTCAQADDWSYDQTNQARSPRNAAFTWTQEGLKYLQQVTGVPLKKNVRIQVHLSGMNAFWTGTTLQFGDGQSGVTYPMTEPDIVVHELGHAFSDAHSGLARNGQSAAISEAFSDMAAVAFMNRKLSKTDFLVGETVTTSGRPLRDLCNPRSSSVLIYDPSNLPLDHVNQWNSGVNAHRASGIYSKAFCLLARKWNIQDAFKVFADANIFYWTQTTTFTRGSCGVLNAAYQLKQYAGYRDAIDVFKTVGITCS